MLYGAGGASSAEDVSYDNTTSGLEADNVQDAIDELNSNLVLHVGDVLTDTFDFYGNFAGGGKLRVCLVFNKILGDDITGATLTNVTDSGAQTFALSGGSLVGQRINMNLTDITLVRRSAGIFLSDNSTSGLANTPLTGFIKGTITFT